MAAFSQPSFSVNILIKPCDGMFLAHCLELDIVAMGATIDEVRREIISLVCAQIDYAFSNDNLENLFHPAPPEVWAEFYACKNAVKREYPLEHGFQARGRSPKGPPLINAVTCQQQGDLCHA